jgi:hypothetical protein
VKDLSTKQRAVVKAQQTEHAESWDGSQKSRQLAVKDLSTEAEGSGEGTADWADSVCAVVICMDCVDWW